MKPLIYALTFCLVCLNADAMLIAYEGFEDNTIGQQLDNNGTGGTGWSNDWNILDARNTEVTIQASTMNYANGMIEVSGGANQLQYLATEGAIDALGGRTFPSQSGTVYLSFLFQNTAEGAGGANSGDDFIQFGFDDNIFAASGQNTEISVLDRNNKIQLRSTTATGNTVDSAFSSLPPNGPYFLVLRADKTGASSTYNQLTLYVNPDNAIEGLNAVGASSSVNSGINLNTSANVLFRKAFLEAGDIYLYDEIRIGTLFEDVITLATPVPEPSTFALGFAIVAGISLMRNCRRG